MRTALVTRIVACVLVLACCVCVSPARGDQDAMAAGAAKIDITPGTPVRLYGYASRKTESEGVAGRLHASALALGADSGPGPAILLAVDCGSVPDAIRDEVLRRVQTRVPLRGERFMLCNSHNHSGPNLKGLGSMEGAEREHLEQYARQLEDQLEQLVLQALAARRPARLEWSQGSVGFASNRRVLKDGRWSGFGSVPGAPVDHSLPLLRVMGLDGKSIALVVNYACHNTTLRGDFKQVHGDWAGCAQEAIEADHPGAVSLVTIGCGADADPHPHGNVQLCQQHGRALADEVKRLMGAPFRPVRGELQARMSTLDIPCASPPPIDQLRETAKTSAAAKRLLEQIKRGETPAASRPYRVAVWAFGDDLAMVFLSDEVVVDYALRLKRQLRGDRLWINAYCNGVSGYIVSQRLLGEGGYEVNSSVSAAVSYGHPESVQPPMEERIVREVRELLPEQFH